ncbi:MAG: diaminobutyrate acetyltransferase [Alphaproteobacteria bacterium]
MREQTTRVEERPEAAEISFRRPTAEDGEEIWSLVGACPPLDQNTLYCYLLQCSHFRDTCIVGERDGRAVGWISGYRPPEEPDTLFVWQVAVHSDARGEALARRLIQALLHRDSLADVNWIKTTVTPDNAASWAMFRSLAQALDAPMASEEWFEQERHFGGRHPSEHLVTIGPFGASRP